MPSFVPSWSLRRRMVHQLRLLAEPAADLALGDRVRTLAGLYTLGATVGFGGLLLGSWPETNQGLFLGLNLAASLSAVLLLRVGERLPTPLLHAMLTTGTAFIGVSQLDSGGAAPAAVLGGYHIFVALYAALYFSGRAAAVHFLAITAVQALVIAEVGSAAPGDAAGMATHLYVSSGMVFGVAVVVRRLFHSQARLAARLREQTLTDPLTGLPNRLALREGIERHTEAARARLCLLLVDIDDFREVNDALGADVGDEVLRLLGKRLRAVPGVVLLARLGTDQYAALLRGRDGQVLERASAVAGQIRATSREPFEIEGLGLSANVRVGIAPGAAGVGFEDLLRQAELALEQAKRDLSGVACIPHVPPRRTPERLQLLGELRSVLAGGAAEQVGRMVPWYQPQIDVHSGMIRGVEALARWEHPVRGLVSPGDFVPLIEQTGLVGELTRHMLTSAIGTCAGWRRSGLDLSVSVNVSARDLADTALPGVVEELLRAAGLEPERLTLEVTETAIMADAEVAAAVLGRIRALGVGVAVDDFGTGWSSLTYLRRLPLTELKIDRSFVAEMDDGDDAAAIVGTVMVLARSLGLRVVAEGVEDTATHARLLAMGCDRAQGWHYGRPVPAAELLADALRRAYGRPPALEAATSVSTLSGGSGGA